MAQSTSNQVLKRIRSKGRGSVIVPRDFRDLGSRGTIDTCLCRLAKAKKIRRLRQGVYDYPRTHSRFGILAPSLPQVADAIARSGRLDLQPSGALAANALGLSTQVPACLVYLTAGTSRRIQIGNQMIHFKRSTPMHLLGAGSAAGLVLQALRHLGPDMLTDDVHAHLSRKLRNRDKQKLAKLAPDAPSWMQPHIARICGKEAV